MSEYDSGVEQAVSGTFYPDKQLTLKEACKEASKDLWAHRSENMRCRTCMWFARKGTGSVGRCRRHAPTMNGYPVVFSSDWCGDHKLDEDKR
jgi:hypothetical protein